MPKKESVLISSSSEESFDELADQSSDSKEEQFDEEGEFSEEGE